MKKYIMFMLGSLCLPVWANAQTTHTAPSTMDLSNALLDASGATGSSISSLAKSAVPNSSADSADGFVNPGSHNPYP